MKQYKKINEQSVIMFYCEDPIVLDKSSSWGEGNAQKHENGCYVQIDNQTGDVSHLVASNPETGMPVGWMRIYGHCYFKIPVFAEQVDSDEVELNTLDGFMTYDNKSKDGWVLYNQTSEGQPDYSDVWFMTNEQFTETYEEILDRLTL